MSVPGNLSVVLDDSVDQSAIIVVDEPKQDIKVDQIDRMTRWIKDVESGHRSVQFWH